MAICISKEKGTKKEPVDAALFIEDYGIEGDAHAGHWHRQVSLLSADTVKHFNEEGAGVTDGDFGENILLTGIDLTHLPVGTHLRASQVELEVTQIGKQCHSHCAIYHRVGHCIMPTEGIFTKVIRGGRMEPGEDMEVLAPDPGRAYTAAVIVLSDSGALGKRVDASGPAAQSYLAAHGYEVLERLLLPDDPARLQQELIRLSDSRQVDVVITSGGTGFSMRDTTPEATMAVADRNAPGIAEAIRAGSMAKTNRAMLSRGVSVIRKSTIIINLPGSPKAVGEGLDIIIDALAHGIEILRGSAANCAS